MMTIIYFWLGSNVVFVGFLWLRGVRSGKVRFYRNAAKVTV